MSNIDENDSEKGPVIETKVLAEIGVDVKQAEHDKALELLAHHRGEAFDPNSAEAKRVLRKIDWHVMTFVFIVYMLQLMDKNSLSYAAIEGIKTATHLTASEYSWLGSLVYFGYLGGDIPATYFLQKFPLAKYFSIMTMFWGIVVACHAGCSNFAGLAVCRVLLGWIEVCTVPAVFAITGSFYTADEQVLRVGLWYASSAMASALGGFFGWCFYHAGPFAWRGIFIFYGGLTLTLGVFMFFFLQATPTEAVWLTDDEKVIALERLRDSKLGSEKWAFNKDQLVEALRDPRFYLIFLVLVSTGLPNGGLTAFGPTIIKGFGFSTARSTLLGMVPGSFELLLIPVFIYMAKKWTRGVAGALACLVGVVGAIMMLAIPAHSFGARYVGYVLTLQYPICVIFLITYCTAGVGGTTKRFYFNCAYQAGFAVGNLIGPQTFQANQAPNYYVAKYIMLAFIAVSGLLILLLEFIHWRWNKQRDAQDAADAAAGIIHHHVENEEFMDLTDKQLRSFRYPL